MLSALFILLNLFIFARPASAADHLYWSATDSEGGYIYRAESDGSNPVKIVEGADKVLGPNGLEFLNGKLFWPDQQLQSVQCSQLDGSQVIAFAMDDNPYDTTGNSNIIFWVSQTGNYIDNQLPDGTGYSRFFSPPDVERPLAVDLTSQYLYWSEAGGQGRVQRSNTDGSNIVTIIPRVLVYDLQVTENYIYFADNNFPDGALKRSNLDGSNIVKLAINPFGGVDLITGICVTDNYIYWSAFHGLSAGIIRRANLDGSDARDLFISPDGMRLRGIVAVQDSISIKPPLFSNPNFGPDGFHFTLTVEPGIAYTIESTSDFREWSIWTQFTSSGTLENFIYPIPAESQSQSQRYFRASTP